MRDADVVVVGAGPAGATAAMLFAREGFRTILLDKAHFPRPKACAEYMSPGVVRVLADLGVEAHVAQRGPARVAGMDIISPGGCVLPVTYGPEHAWTLPRRSFDAALVRSATDAGAGLQQGFVARSLLREGGRISGVSGTESGRTEQVSARLTVVADGARSILARDLGLARPARWPVRLGLVAHYRGPADLHRERGQMHVGRRGYCGVAPLPDGHLNVAVVSRLDAPRRAALSPTAFFDDWITENPSIRTLLRSCERVSPVRGVGPVGSRAARAFLPGCLLVGDAASFFDPFTGEGIYRALRGAQIAAQVGAAALLEGTEGTEGLCPYERMRNAAFREKSMVTALVQLFVQYPLLMEYALARLGRRESPHEALNLVLGDMREARTFLNPQMLWGALRP